MKNAGSGPLPELGSLWTHRDWQCVGIVTGYEFLENKVWVELRYVFRGRFDDDAWRPETFDGFGTKYTMTVWTRV